MKQPKLAGLLSEPPGGVSGLVVAYSGGRDSTALLHALACMNHPLALRAVHVCHHLESAAADWALHCARYCALLDVPHARLDVSVDPTDGGLESAARDARYAALVADLAPGEVLVTAHHAEDQAETFLLQALRGAGVAGLAGMPRLASFGPGRIWRPWLAVPRAEILAYAGTHGLDWVEDDSNRDPRRARGHLRNRVWPALLEQWPAAAETLARSAAWAGQANEAITTLAGVDLEAVRGAGDTLRIEGLAALSPARRAEVVRRWLSETDRDRPDHRHLAEIERLLGAREHAGPRVAFADTEVRRFDARLFAMARLPEPPPAGTEFVWHEGGHMLLPAGCGELSLSVEGAGRIPPGLSVAFARPGERLRRGDDRAEAVSEYLRRMRVPPWIRARMPRIRVGDTLLALPGRWEHPRIADWFDGRVPRFDWQHNLVGDPAGRSRRD
ncbi:MAG: tRNA lysidine(34) synthetase TilS [Salinisphaera sp.]|uniref:tRNA lysidine(34) synthetase TilS n=1 Tax=Salinisphaera sp. TaxID=1914330 RepID=UPI003C7D9F20